MKKKIVFIVSHGGSVIFEILKNEKLNFYEYLFISDWKCKAIDHAKKNSYIFKILESKNGHEFSKKLDNYFKNSKIEFFYFFYDKILTSVFFYKRRKIILNYHPSVLPSNPGSNGFEDSIKDNKSHIGFTVHFINKDVDKGKILLQMIFKNIPKYSLKYKRHKIFVGMCKSLIQILIWLKDGRIKNFLLENNKNNRSNFNPNLEHLLSKNFKIIKWNLYQ